MKGCSCFLTTDLSEIRVFGAADASVWEPAATDPETIDQVREARSRIIESARWLSALDADARQIDVVCLDISETRCLWVRSPSTEEPVLAARLRTAGEDWGDLLMRGTAEALAGGHVNGTGKGGSTAGILKRINQPVNPAQSPNSAMASTVLHVPDAIIRLWLDEVDRQGLRVGLVATLWHAMAWAWSETPSSPMAAAPLDHDDDAEPADELVAVVLVDAERGRLVWSWSSRAELLAGGSTTLVVSGDDESSSVDAHSLDRAGNRLSLDWLAWAGNLSRTPDRIVIVGLHTHALVGALSKRWADTAISTVEHADPVSATLESAVASAESTSHHGPRKCLARLTSRPTRAVRRRYRWIAAALVLFAVGIGGIAWRMGSTAKELSAAAIAQRKAANDHANELGDVSIRRPRDKVKALRAMLATISGQAEIEFPPPPHNIHRELLGALEAMKPFKDDGDLLRITIDAGRQSIIQYKIMELRPRTDLKLALENLSTELLWQESKRATRNDMLQMEGSW